jgi:hypothetical protein
MFDPHGTFELLKDSNIIIVKVEGSFNTSGIIRGTKALREIIQTFNNTPFFILMNNQQYEGCTPDAFESSEELNRWLSHQNMVAKAIVCSNKAIIDINLKNVPSLVKQEIRYFGNIADALQWLKSLSEVTK